MWTLPTLRGVCTSTMVTAMQTLRITTIMFVVLEADSNFETLSIVWMERKNVVRASNSIGVKGLYLT